MRKTTTRKLTVVLTSHDEGADMMSEMSQSDNNNNGKPKRIHSIAEWANFRAMSQSDIVRETGIDKSTISRWFSGQTPSMNSLRRLADVLQTDVDSLLMAPEQFEFKRQALKALGDIPNGSAGRNVFLSHASQEYRPKLTAKQDLTEKVFLLYSDSVAGEDGEYQEKVPTQWSYTAADIAASIYSVVVLGETMEPRFCDGDFVFVNPELPVRKGDYVCARITNYNKDDPSRAYFFIKRMVRYTTNELVLAQINPEKHFSFEYKQVRSLHRITYVKLRDALN
jgi:transcriptional regulator with XRE-family HTH domain